MRVLEFATKAQNLKNLEGRITKAKVLPLLILGCEMLDDVSLVLKKVQNFFPHQKLIIRSSSYQEDSKTKSNAGAFLSLLDIDSGDEQMLLDALNQVAQTLDAKDEILLQPMLDGISMCGVAFSVDKDNFSPYIQIEYDCSGSSSSITDGSAMNISSFIHFREAALPQNEAMAKVIELIFELEEIFDCKHLDIEFAFVGDELYLLQVRPLVMEGKSDFYHCITLDLLKRFAKRFEGLQNRHFDIFGTKTLFGVMPDWNPAEIIGLRPKRLALSLYKEIVTDSIWAYQRDNYGYKALRSHPLMHSFFGIPYIDVRLSFNSFIPKGVDKRVADKLVNYYLDRLQKMPELHDKVEFEIVISCLDFSYQKHFDKLLAHGFLQDEIDQFRAALGSLTQNIIDPNHGLYIKDIQKSLELKGRYQDILDSNLSLIDRIYWLIENCKRYGTLPFAGVARAAFVAMQLLDSLCERGVFSLQDREDFLASLHTISKQLSEDYALMDEGNKEEFLSKYGHLRAGSYDITSLRYDKNFKAYFGTSKMGSFSKKTFSLDSQKEMAIKAIIDEIGLKITPLELLDFFKRAIEAREMVKFEFTRLLSCALELIGDLGEHYGISREDMAFLDIKTILSLYASLHTQSPKTQFLEQIEYYKKEYEITQALRLPPLIRDAKDIFSFSINKNVANFITQKRVRAFSAMEGESDLEGKIVLIYAADPGFDYLFTKNIAGFITCYGGANSHMAIRASELGVAAVIGVGEEMFKKCCAHQQIEIDCQAERIVLL